jgi:hypothetical protein
MSRRDASPAQLSLLEVFAQEEYERQTSHLPRTIEEAVPYYRGLIERYDAAIMAGDQEHASTIAEEADLLAIRLNGDTRLGIKADEQSPCSVLERATNAPNGTIPRWGQTGTGLAPRFETNG